MKMTGYLIYGMIYLGSALMVYNIITYIWFARRMKGRGNWDTEGWTLNLPIVLLVLFLFGYLAVGIFGRPDFVISSILFGGSVFVFVIQRLTGRIAEHIQKNEMLEAKLMAAEEANAAKTFFFSNMSHDIRTPLNTIIGYTVLARKSPLAAHDEHGYLEKIDRAGHHLLAIVNDVLDMSRIESGKVDLEPDSMDIEEDVRQIGDLVSPQMNEKHIRFSVDCAVTDRWVMCDKTHLDRVLMNILSNAYKFTPENRSVSLSLRQTESGDDFGSYEIRIRDTGIGMSREFAKNLFAPFERERTSTVSRTQGTGLGMAITKRIVEMMGGDIQVATEKDKGTEFIVRLTFPIAAEKEDAEAARAAVDLAGKRLLLVEDNEVNRELAKMILLQSGFRVETAEDGRVAVDMVAASEPGYYDAVLMDIQMPVMDGYAATKAIRALENRALAATPIIAMTANAFKEDARAAEEAGMQGHITKPIKVDFMLETLQAVLGRS